MVSISSESMGTSRTPLSTREPGGNAVFFFPDLGPLPESDLAPESGATPSFTSDFDEEPSFLRPLSLAGLNVEPSSKIRCTSLSVRRGPFQCVITLCHGSYRVEDF